VNAVRTALQGLPCVDSDSVSVSKEKKEARFTTKPDAKCDIEQVKKAISDAGKYEVTEVKGPTSK
jgi:copper chaperone CopZ